jgi:hypothetical protein
VLAFFFAAGPVSPSYLYVLVSPPYDPPTPRGSAEVSEYEYCPFGEDDTEVEGDDEVDADEIYL